MPQSTNILIVLLGPTGVGKTDASIHLSKIFDAPILSCDSRQFFREMRVGTAVPTPEQLRSAEHHFIGSKSVTERYSCGMFELDAIALLDRLFVSHQFAMLVGGSMLYIDAVCSGIDDFPAPDPEIRGRLHAQLRANGLESLTAQLKHLDPDYYNRVDLQNSQRVLKALEVCLQTGRTYTSFLTKPAKPRPFRIVKVGLNRPREELYVRINQRVDQMMAQGLLNEAQSLYPLKHLTALNTVGYRELFDYIEGKTTLNQAIDLIKRNTRRYAKRQLTWWGRDKGIRWFHPGEVDAIADYVLYTKDNAPYVQR